MGMSCKFEGLWENDWQYWFLQTAHRNKDIFRNMELGKRIID